MPGGAGDLDVARAGAAFAARREELGISQRELARRKVISAPSLIAFEKGKAWPRERTLDKLEKVVQWPPGTLAKLSAGAAVPQASQAPASGGAKGVDETADVVREAVEMASRRTLARVEELPEDADPAFTELARAVLAELRQLDGLATRAVRSSRGAPEVIALRRDIRTRYEELMFRAAAAPGATLGQRLYAARVSSALSTDELAAVLDLSPEVVAAAEADQPVSEDSRRRMLSFVVRSG